MANKYLVGIRLTKILDHDVWKECGWSRTYVDEIPRNDDGFSFDLGDWAIENGFLPRIWGKKTNFVRIDANYYDLESDRDDDYLDPDAELHAYVQKNENGKYESV